MTAAEILLAILLGLIVNEFSDVSPWLARKVVRWSARVQYGTTTRAEIRAEEHAALIDERPGKLFKLGTASRFLGAALAVRVRRLVVGERAEGDPDSIGDLMAGDLPSRVVGRFLFPTERFRGEWRRHWIHIVKALLFGWCYALLAAAAAWRQIDHRYVGWVTAGIVVAAVVWSAFRVVGWFFKRIVITNKRLMSTEGVLVRRVAMIPLLRVTDMRYVQSPLGRVLSYGTFRLESANVRNALRTIKDLPNPNELYLRLVEEMYEPEAVEARLGVPDAIELDAFEEAEPPPQPDLAEQVGVLSAQVATLASAVQDLHGLLREQRETPV